ncbi:protein kinase [Sorangium sp. So ce375]|uniref:serine/threonine-protein kinase n=1 Tax=Sorangium sp. So ce375 TaxID=3133306 RepID=UPI003F5B200F
MKAGDVLAGKYRVERVLGQGGMGLVVAARHTHLHQLVAIKVLLSSATPEAVERFLREGRASVRIRSEHAARVHDVDTLPSGAPFMVMEYLDGRDLAAVIATEGPQPIAQAVGYVLEACEAIAEAHAHGIIHRDIKPANLFLTRAADGSQTIKVLDFGISKALTDEAGGPELALTKSSALLGSPLYMSPEQMRASHRVDARSDIWSMGVVLYQLLTARIPFPSDTFGELILKVNGDPPDPIAQVRTDLLLPLEGAIYRCLEKDPARRFANIAELARAIAPFGPPQQASISLERIERVLGMQVTPSAYIDGRSSQPHVGGRSSQPSQPHVGGRSSQPSQPHVGGRSSQPSQPHVGGGSSQPSQPSPSLAQTPGTDAAAGLAPTPITNSSWASGPTKAARKSRAAPLAATAALALALGAGGALYHAYALRPATDPQAPATSAAAGQDASAYTTAAAHAPSPAIPADSARSPEGTAPASATSAPAPATSAPATSAAPTEPAKEPRKPAVVGTPRPTASARTPAPTSTARPAPTPTRSVLDMPLQ